MYLSYLYFCLRQALEKRKIIYLFNLTKRAIKMNYAPTSKSAMLGKIEAIKYFLFPPLLVGCLLGTYLQVSNAINAIHFLT